MKKIIRVFCATAIIVVCGLTSKAQSFEQGSFVLQGGIGIQSGITPIIVNAEYGVADAIGVGAGLQFYSQNGVSATLMTVRGAYHFGEFIKNDQLDLYAGAELLFPLSGGGSGAVFSLMPGARYYFSDNIGAFSELGLFLSGGGGTQLRLGIAFKLGGN
jgi:hypothetical protein